MTKIAILFQIKFIEHFYTLKLNHRNYFDLIAERCKITRTKIHKTQQESE